MKMQIPLAKLEPNPLRDFKLYPYDDDQIRRLAQSIDDLGFFSGITVRPHPTKKGRFQIAAGHHRVKAAEVASINEVEAVCDNYSDEEMVAVMTIENLTQRGHNAASTLDSVAANARIVTRDVLLGEGATAKILAVDGQLSQNQAKIAKEGPGINLLYRAINGFSKEDRADNKRVEQLTETELQAALNALKQSGHMAKIVAEEYRVVEAIRTTRDAEAKHAAEEAVRQAELAEERAKRAAEREAEAKARADAKARTAAAADSKAKAKAEAEAQAARERAAEQRQAREKADAEAKDKRAKTDATAKAAAAEQERRRNERDAIEAQRRLDAVYDAACVNQFYLGAHEKAFRDAVLSENGRRFIPRDQQLALAKAIRAKMDEIGRDSRAVGSQFVANEVTLVLERAMGLQRDIDREEKERLLRESRSKRVMELWTAIRRAVQNAEVALEKIGEEQEAWPYAPDLFPVDSDAIERIAEIGKRFEALRKKLGIVTMRDLREAR